MRTIRLCDGHLFKEGLLGSRAWLSVNREEVDELNVFPVPDGDTGTNMLLTLESAVEAVKDMDESDLSRIARRAAHGALMGARGNSGVILSQVFRGFADGVGQQAAVDAGGLAGAFAEAAIVAYRAVIKPTEGTMLTVAREAARAAGQKAKESDDILEIVRAACEAAQRAVERTPEQLEILRQAGVVDSGGFGLQVILEGFLKRMRGESVQTFTRPQEQHARPRRVESPDEGWGYCTEFVINEASLPVERIREEIAQRGQSTLVVGDESAVKVHVHTREPATLIAYARELGAISRLKVDDMSAQHHRLQGEAPRRPASMKRLAVVAVASGDGFRRILESLGVDCVVTGGQTMNPSTEDLLSAVESAPANEVLLLPNNANIVLAAQQVGQLSRKRMRVVPSRSLPQGIAALFAFDFQGSLEENAVSMTRALSQVATIELTRAVRDSQVGELLISEGELIGLLNDRVVANGASTTEVVAKILDQVNQASPQTVTIYSGAEAKEAEVEQLSELFKQRYRDATVESQKGGQELYPFVIALE